MAKNHPVKEKPVSRPKSKSSSKSKSDNSNSWFFKLCLSARLFSAIFSYLSDCDETFNFWEPTHYLASGYGFQTWEYAKQYALRSYSFIFPTAVLSYSLGNLSSSKVFIFYMIRCVQASICAYAESYFCESVVRKFGMNVGLMTYVFLVFSPGMFISSAAFLPSSCSMLCTFMAYHHWLSDNNPMAIFFIAVSSIFSWPFACITGTFIAFDIILRKGIFMFLKCSLFDLVIVTVPIMLIDYLFYDQMVLTPLKIIMYNVFSKHGSELYGTEPLSFYFVNGFLNFNIAFVFALISLPVVFVSNSFIGKAQPITILPLFCMMTFYLWMLTFCLQPHKEERFLFPIYPLIALCGSFAVDALQKVYLKLKRPGLNVTEIIRTYHTQTETFQLMLTGIGLVFSISRCCALYMNYQASIDIYLKFNQAAHKETDKYLMGAQPGQLRMCFGKEWHRFPTHYLLPTEMRGYFIKSAFEGQLPRHYGGEATSTRPNRNATANFVPFMNDMNLEEPERYVDVAKCHYLVDLDPPAGSDFKASPLEPQYSLDTTTWDRVIGLPYLFPSNENDLLSRVMRAFYVPFLHSRFNRFGELVILKNRLLKKP